MCICYRQPLQWGRHIRRQNCSRPRSLSQSVGRLVPRVAAVPVDVSPAQGGRDLQGLLRHVREVSQLLLRATIALSEGRCRSRHVIGVDGDRAVGLQLVAQTKAQMIADTSAL